MAAGAIAARPLLARATMSTTSPAVATISASHRLQPDVVRGRAGGGDPGADHRGHQQGRPGELGRCPPRAAHVSAPAAATVETSSNWDSAESVPGTIQ